MGRRAGDEGGGWRATLLSGYISAGGQGWFLEVAIETQMGENVLRMFLQWSGCSEELLASLYQR